MTRKEIMEETFHYYEKDPSRRATSETGCYYLQNKKMCAVGRYIDWRKVNQLHISPSWLNSKGMIDSVALSIMEEYDTSIEMIFKNRYRTHPIGFWIGLQTYHDNDQFWEGDNSVELREKKKTALLNEWAEKEESI